MRTDGTCSAGAPQYCSASNSDPQGSTCLCGDGAGAANLCASQRYCWTDGTCSAAAAPACVPDDDATQSAYPCMCGAALCGDGHCWTDLSCESAVVPVCIPSNSATQGETCMCDGSLCGESYCWTDGTCSESYCCAVRAIAGRTGRSCFCYLRINGAFSLKEVSLYYRNLRQPVKIVPL